MSNSANATNAARAEYGFELNFPKVPFTMKKLRALKGGKVQYITLYMRVRKALKDGVITVVGKQTPKTKRKGRQLLVYARTDVASAVTPAKANVPA